MHLHNSLNLIIPNYNSAKLIAETLSRLRDLYPETTTYVVDDASTDGSVELLRERFPSVQVIARCQNGGFGAAANDGIRAGDSEFVVLLNADVEVKPGFLEHILPLFEDESVFAVSPSIITPSLGGIDDGPKTAFWRHGMLWVDNIQGVHEVRPVFFTSGCASVYRRSMLEALDGFDEAYSPFYWEDVDLSYRAWKRGWKSLFQPASSVLHQHSATISKIPSGYTRAVKARNQLLFIWRNIEDERLVRDHRRWLPLVLFRRALSGDWPWIRGWRLALAKRAEALAARRRDSAQRVLSDRDIFAYTNCVLQL